MSGLIYVVRPFSRDFKHAKRENLILLHQNNQIQNLNTTTVVIIIFFFNEMNKGHHIMIC